jgi:hypothetical protein
VQDDKSRAPEFAAPIHRPRCQRRVELLFREIAQVSLCGLSCSVPGSEEGRHRRAILFAPTVERHVLQGVDPPFLTGEDMDKLFPDRRVAESGDRLVTEFLRHGCNVAEQEIEPFVSCGV